MYMIECENIELGNIGKDGGDGDRNSSIGLRSGSSISKSSSDCGESFVELFFGLLIDELSWLFSTTSEWAFSIVDSGDGSMIFKSSDLSLSDSVQLFEFSMQLLLNCNGEECMESMDWFFFWFSSHDIGDGRRSCVVSDNGSWGDGGLSKSSSKSSECCDILSMSSDLMLCGLLT